MIDAWQEVLRRVVLANPRHFASWILPGARYIQTESGELSPGYHLGIVRSGPLLRVERGGEEVLLHLEFQGLDESMDTYTFVRHTLAARLYRRPVLSYILCIRNEEPLMIPPLQATGVNGESLLCFHYTVIKLWEYTTHDLLKTGFSSLLPLLPLASDGAYRRVVDSMIGCILAVGQFDLLEASRVLAVQAFTNEFDRYWLEKKLRAYIALVD